MKIFGFEITLTIRRIPAPISKAGEPAVERWPAARMRAIRDSIPVDDQELSQAKPALDPKSDPRKCIRCGTLTYTPDHTSELFICAGCKSFLNGCKASLSSAPALDQ
jgi:hypothetical protein